MMTSPKVAIVTGSNKGVGYAVVKGLCEQFNGTVYLTARDEGRGEAAVKELKDLGCSPLFHQLDVNDQISVDKFKEYIKNAHGGIDLLVNNAAVAFNEAKRELLPEHVEETVKTNYFGLLRVCEAFLPLLRDDAQIINVSSSAGHLSRIPSAELRSKFSDPELTVTKLSDLMNQFVEDTFENVAGERGWNESAYVVSKVGVCALTRIQQRELDAELAKRNISVNSVHPGYVNTDMTNHKGVLTIEEGARSTLYLSLQQHNLKGQYVWKDSSVVDWLAPSTPASR